jgi:hypothetical protein
MSATRYEDLKAHIGHKICIVWYGNREEPDNIAVECETCNEVLLDFDKGDSK